MQNASKSKWRLDGVRVARANELDPNTPQTPGMDRAAAINHARAGAEKLWAGTVVIDPKARTGAFHIRRSMRATTWRCLASQTCCNTCPQGCIMRGSRLAAS